ncbi:TRDC protein, partial [Pedionomus torquatus]|nr:TRDC protein [Pedionomus torquatus]
LKSKEPKKYDNKHNMACLARNFYPKNISLDVPKSDTVYDLKAPLVTSVGMYSTIKVAEVELDAEVPCKAMHKGDNITASTILPGHALFPLLLFKADVKMEKANMLFVAVLGFRVLLAKSITLNIIMSIMLFLS